MTSVGFSRFRRLSWCNSLVLLASSSPSGFWGTCVSAPLSMCYFFSCLALSSLLQLTTFKRCCVSILVFFSGSFLEQKPIWVARGMGVPGRQRGISFICSMPIRCSCAPPWCPSLCVPPWLQIQHSDGPWKGGRGYHSSFLPLLLACASNGRGLSTSTELQSRIFSLLQGNKPPKSIHTWGFTSIARTSS